MLEDLEFLQGFSVRTVRVQGNLTAAIVCKTCNKHLIRGKKNLRNLEDACLAAISHECKGSYATSS